MSPGDKSAGEGDAGAAPTCQASGLVVLAIYERGEKRRGAFTAGESKRWNTELSQKEQFRHFTCGSKRV
jgi:hypothetical protein